MARERPKRKKPTFTFEVLTRPGMAPSILMPMPDPPAVPDGCDVITFVEYLLADAERQDRCPSLAAELETWAHELLEGEACES